MALLRKGRSLMCAPALDTREEVCLQLTQRDVELAAIERDFRENPHHIHTVVLLLGLNTTRQGIKGLKADPFHR